MGGESGRSMEACLDIAAWLEEESGLSLGGVTGGAGMLGVVPLLLPLPLTLELGGSGERAVEEEVMCRSRCEPERVRGALEEAMAMRFSGCSVCRRMSDSLAAGTTPRLRRKGILEWSGVV